MRLIVEKNRVLKVISICIVIIIVCIYFFLFFQKGIIFEGKFLKQDKSTPYIQYKGYVNGVPVNILVDNAVNADSIVNVTYEIGKIIRQYSIEFFNEYGVKVYQNDILLFSGKYIPDKNGIELFENNGKPYIKGMINVVVNNEDIFNETYQVGLLHIIKTAAGDNIVNRGNPMLLFIAMLFLVIILIDIKYPKFFFYLRHGLSVEDPEPSEVYVTIQKATWYIASFIIIILLILSLFKPMV